MQHRAHALAALTWRLRHAKALDVDAVLRHACGPQHAGLLAAAAAAGIELPFSCTTGVCGTCRARVLEGDVAMARNFALDARELEAGFVLVCQAQPLSERLVLSFDQR